MTTSSPSNNTIVDITERNLRALRQLLFDTTDFHPVAFLGAGFSIWISSDVSVPRGWRSTWDGLIACISDYLPSGYGPKLIELATDDNIKRQRESILSLAERLYGTDYTTALTKSFWIDHAECRRLVNTIRESNPIRWSQASDLFRRSRGVVTTNFDPLAWHIAQDCQKQYDQRWRIHTCDASSGIPKDAITQMVGPCQSYKPLVYMHGGLFDPITTDWPHNASDSKTRVSRLVLSSYKYAEAYFYGVGDDVSISRSTFVRELFENCPLLFLGFSLTDTLINQCMNQARLNLLEQSPQHFAIVHGATDQTILRSLPPPDSVAELYEQVYGIKPIFLDGRLNSATGLTIGEALDSLWGEFQSKLKREERAAIRSSRSTLIRDILETYAREDTSDEKR